jgi:Zn-dependent protease
MRFQTPSDPFVASGKTEAFELLKAWAATSIAFTIVLRSNVLPLPYAALAAAVSAGLGVVLHELGHRVVARHYGAEARFWANDVWLVISIVSAFAGFLIAAPGAVWHSGFLTKRQSGLVSAAGPVVNMVLAVIFLIGYLLMLRFGLDKVPIEWIYVMRAGFQINAWLGFFNMIPIGPIDGAKILNWSMPVFGVLLAIGVALAFGFDRIEGQVIEWLLPF